MSDKIKDSFIFKINEFYRINFIGRPTELRKLVEDKYTFITSKEDADKIISAHRNYYGWQYFGNICSLFSYLIYIKLSKRIEFSGKSHFYLLFLGISPIFTLYIYSHFTFWDEIRPVVLKNREVANSLRKNVYEFETKGFSENYNKDEFLIMYNKNLDLHKYVLENISFFSCLKEILNLNKK